MMGTKERKRALLPWGMLTRACRQATREDTGSDLTARQYRHGSSGQAWTAALILAVWALVSPGLHAQGLTGLYREGVLVDSFFESTPSGMPQASPLPRSAQAKALPDTETPRFPDIIFGPVAVSAQTQERNALFARAGEPGVAIRDLLRRMQLEPDRDATSDQGRLQTLLGQLRAQEAEMRVGLEDTGRHAQELGVDPAILDRHTQTMQAFEAGYQEFYGAIEAVIAGEYGASERALAVVERLKFREDPPLLHSGLPFQRHVQEAPLLTREEADAQIAPIATAKAVPITLLAAPPTPEDLAETPDIKFMPEIVAKAAELNNSPQAIFDFVSDSVAFQTYLGSRKGAAVTLEQLRGNDTDQASLLIALLRAAGIPARYVRGTAESDPAAVMNWLGVDDAATAASILTTAGLDGVAITSGLDVVAIRWTHVWVEAYVPYSNYRGVANEDTGPTWVALDPGFKQSRLALGEDVLTPMGFDVDAFIAAYISTVSVPDPLEQLELDIQAYIDANDPGKTVADIERRREIAPRFLGLLPGSPSFSALAISGRFSELEASKRYKVRFHLYDGGTDFIDHTIDLPELAGKRLTIEYVGATPADQDTIDAFGGIYETPPNLVNVVPVLELDGVAIATSINGIGMGYSHSSDMQFIQPVGAFNVQPLVQNQIIAGNGQAVGFDTFLDVRDSFLGGDTAYPAEDFLEGILHTTANDYLSRVDRGLEKAERLMRVVTTQDVSEAIVENAISVSFSFGVPVTFEWTGLIVDADRRIIGTFDVDGGSAEDIPFMMVTGAHGSLMENRVFEEMFAQDAVSTIKILQLASDAGIGICMIETSVFGDCPAITQPSHIISALNAALALGSVITIPEDPITVSLWSGTGYIEMDPTSGAGGYIISGGISGAVQTLSGGATVESWPVNLTCTLVPGTMNADVIIPPRDTPDEEAVFCPDDSRISFTIKLTYDCEGDPGKELDVSRTTTMTAKEIVNAYGAGEYTIEYAGAPPVPGKHPRKIDILKPQFEIFPISDRLRMHERNVGTGDEKSVAHVWETSRQVDLTTYLDAQSQTDAVTLGDKLRWVSGETELPSSTLDYGDEPGVGFLWAQPEINSFNIAMQCEGEMIDEAIVVVVRRDANTLFTDWEGNNPSPPASDGWISQIPNVYSSLTMPGLTDPEGEECDFWEFATNTNNYHPGMAHEGRGRRSLFGPGNQATYNADGNLINNIGRGSRLSNGTADQENASNELNVSEHIDADVLPFIRALQLDGNPTQCVSNCGDLSQAAIIDADHTESYFGRRPPTLGSALAPGACP